MSATRQWEFSGTVTMAFTPSSVSTTNSMRSGRLTRGAMSPRRVSATGRVKASVWIRFCSSDVASSASL